MEMLKLNSFIYYFHFEAKINKIKVFENLLCI